MPDDGGPAFPTIEGTYLPETGVIHFADYGLCEPGMSLRDWYAGLAMQSIICGGMTNSSAAQAILEETANTDVRSSYECIAHKAFRYADAMLAHKNKSTEADGDGNGEDTSRS